MTWLSPFDELKQNLAKKGLDQDPKVQKALQQYEDEAASAAEEFKAKQKAKREGRVQ